MSYVQNNLLKNEKVVLETRMHWIVFAMPILLFCLLLILAILSPLLFPGHLPLLNIRLNSVVLLIVLAVAVYSAVATYIRYTTSEYAITNKRVLIKVGWLRRDSLELFVDKVETIYVDQSLLGRILDYGTLRIIGTGGTRDVFFYVPKPLVFRKIAQEQISDSQ